MLTEEEKRNYTRMHIDCDIHYKFAGSSFIHQGRCTSISGSGVSFISDLPIDPGKALEIKVAPKNSITPAMTAFIEVVRITQKSSDSYEIAAAVKSIKGS